MAILSSRLAGRIVLVFRQSAQRVSLIASSWNRFNRRITCYHSSLSTYPGDHKASHVRPVIKRGIVRARGMKVPALFVSPLARLVADQEPAAVGCYAILLSQMAQILAI